MQAGLWQQKLSMWQPLEQLLLPSLLWQALPVWHGAALCGLAFVAFVPPWQRSVWLFCDICSVSVIRGAELPLLAPVAYGFSHTPMRVRLARQGLIHVALLMNSLVH